jgi:hypothetical protein
MRYRFVFPLATGLLLVSLFDQCCGSMMFIPDPPGSELFPSRIPIQGQKDLDPHPREIILVTQKIVSKLSDRDVYPGFGS